MYIKNHLKVDVLPFNDLEILPIVVITSPEF